MEPSRPDEHPIRKPGEGSGRRWRDATVALLAQIRALGGWRAGGRRLAEAEAGLLRDLLRPKAASARLDEVTALHNLVTKEAVSSIVALRIPDLVATGTTHLAALAAATGADPDALRRVCTHLVARGILREDAPGVVALSDVGELLRSDHPERRALCFAPGSAVAKLERALSGMWHSLEHGTPAYATVHGRTFWEDAAEDPLLAESFDAEMARHARSVGSALAKGYDWAPIRHVVDVGGGTGEVLRCLLRRNVHLRGTIVEYAAAAVRARRGLEREGLAGRIEVVEASFFEGLPAGADAYLVSWILHDWDDDDAVTILDCCRAAVPEGGRVLVIEQPFDVTRNSDLDLRMLVFFGGRERTRQEYEALAAKAGLRVASWRPLRDGMWLMDARGA